MSTYILCMVYTANLLIVLFMFYVFLFESQIVLLCLIKSTNWIVIKFTDTDVPCLNFGSNLKELIFLSA